MKLTERAKYLTSSIAANISEKSAELKKQGIDVIRLNVGEPDYNTFPNICEAGKKAIDDGHTRYPLIQGVPELREAISQKLREENGLNYSVAEIDVTVGAKQAVFNAVLAVCDPGEEVIIPVPCWVSYTDMVRIAGGIPVQVPVRSDDWMLDVDEIEKAITPKTRAVIICTPNNPTGAVYGEDVLRRLAEVCVKHDIYIISDEVYEKFVFDDAKHFCIASISEEVKQRVLMINGFSKAYSMTGWRLGYLAANKEIIRVVKCLQTDMTSAACSISQYAAIDALKGDQSLMHEMCSEFSKRRLYLYNRLKAMKGIECPNAKGAMYLMPSIDKYIGSCMPSGKKIENSIDFALYILEEAHVAVVPGEAYHAPGYIRITYANSMTNIEKAMDAFEAALEKLKC